MCCYLRSLYKVEFQHHYLLKYADIQVCKQFSNAEKSMMTQLSVVKTVQNNQKAGINLTTTNLFFSFSCTDTK